VNELRRGAIPAAFLCESPADTGVGPETYGLSAQNFCGYPKISGRLGIYQQLSDNFT
jgi:hypothetical protein